MQPIRIIYDDTPDSIPVPEELRHRKAEIILWPLDERGADEESDSNADKLPRRPGSARGKLAIIADDDEHLSDFKDYMP
jgi:hypothetical protein